MLKFERLEEACAQLEQAVRAAPNNVFFLSYLGGVYGRLGRVREAVRVLSAAIARQPDFAPAVFTLALTFEAHGELAAAAECYERVLTLEPSLAEAAARLSSLRGKQPVAVAHARFAVVVNILLS